MLEHYYRGSASDTSNVFSVTKSFVGTLIGIAIWLTVPCAVWTRPWASYFRHMPPRWNLRKPLSRCGNCSP